MGALQRTTSAVLLVTVLLCLLASLVGAVLVVLCDPRGSAVVVMVACGAAVALTLALGAPLEALLFFAPLFTVFALGLYALHRLCGVLFDDLRWIAAALAGLVMLTLGVGLSAMGDPYDD